MSTVRERRPRKAKAPPSPTTIETDGLQSNAAIVPDRQVATATAHLATRREILVNLANLFPDPDTRVEDKETTGIEDLDDFQDDDFSPSPGLANVMAEYHSPLRIPEIDTAAAKRPREPTGDTPVTQKKPKATAPTLAARLTAAKGKAKDPAEGEGLHAKPPPPPSGLLNTRSPSVTIVDDSPNPPRSPQTTQTSSLGSPLRLPSPPQPRLRSTRLRQIPKLTAIPPTAPPKVGGGKRSSLEESTQRLEQLEKEAKERLCDLDEQLKGAADRQEKASEAERKALNREEEAHLARERTKEGDSSSIPYDTLCLVLCGLALAHTSRLTSGSLTKPEPPFPLLVIYLVKSLEPHEISGFAGYVESLATVISYGATRITLSANNNATGSRLTSRKVPIEGWRSGGNKSEAIRTWQLCTGAVSSSTHHTTEGNVERPPA
ncbi:hypothetical protein IW262DRAFT_1485889 [Armillaria fumosa]|nr:hypothetical protein IW262DRAFT_1485889 [Armillaria fumosa]